MIDVTDVDFEFPSVGSLAAETYLQQAANTFDAVGDELWGVARSELLAGFEAGESIEQLADRLRHSAGLTAKKAVLVARTQIIEANNAASIATARAAGLDMQKEWMSAEDRRVRPAHAEANGQRVDLNDKFLVGGYQADYPGDPVLSPALRYSCRCTVGYVMPDDAVDQAHQQAELPLELPNTSGAEPIPSVLPATPVSVAQPELTRAEKRAAARARQKEIATADGNARLLAEVDELAAKKATKKTIQSRIDPALIEPDQLFANADPALLDQLREAVTSTAVARLQTVVGRIAAERGLVPIGEAGERLPFDPSRMQAVEGAAIADGDLVEVIRQGHVMTLTGEDIQLDRAVVMHVITDSLDEMETRSLRSLAGEYEIPNYLDLNRADLLRGLRAAGAQSPAQARAALLAQRAEAERLLAERYAQFPIPDKVPDLGDIFEDGARLLESDPKFTMGAPLEAAPWERLVGGEFSGGITAVDVSATLVQAGNSRELAIILIGQLKRRGREIGAFSRSYRRKANGDLLASHTFLQISKGAQGSGFSNEFNGRLIAWYRRSGVKSVELHADIDVGGYAWARSGYDFANQDAADKILARLGSAVRRRTLAKRLVGAPDVDVQVRLGRELLKRAEGKSVGDDGFPTAFEVSQVGRWAGAGKDDMWIGKLVMLGSDWTGVLRL